MAASRSRSSHFIVRISPGRWNRCGERASAALVEAMRQAVNAWIRQSGRFDAVIDFDAATRDPADPLQLNPAFNPGDHVHPNDAGNRALADAIDLAIFTAKQAD